MADVKITELPELTAVAADDYLEIVDTSTNTNKKISRETLTNFAWTDWTPTVTDWAAGYTVKLARYTVIGKTCFFSVDISGTSNSTEVKIALPHMSATGNFDGYWGGPCAFFRDNGPAATAPGRWYVGKNSATLVAHTNMAYGTWTATGTKRVVVTGFYEIA